MVAFTRGYKLVQCSNSPNLNLIGGGAGRKPHVDRVGPAAACPLDVRGGRARDGRAQGEDGQVLQRPLAGSQGRQQGVQGGLRHPRAAEPALPSLVQDAGKGFDIAQSIEYVISNHQNLSSLSKCNKSTTLHAIESLYRKAPLNIVKPLLYQHEHECEEEGDSIDFKWSAT